MGKGKTADLHKHWKKDKLSIKQRQKDKLTGRNEINKPADTKANWQTDARTKSEP